MKRLFASMQRRAAAPSSRPALWALPAALAVGALLTGSFLARDAVADVRVKVEGGETVEAMAERYYGDTRKAAVIRAANRIADGVQPAVGAFLKLPGPTMHTVQAGETLDKVANRFLSGEGGADLLAEANDLRKNAKLKRGQVLTVFAEVEVRTAGRSAEDLAGVFLNDANLGARVRRYNGVRDGGKLPGKVYLPLVGVVPRADVAAAPAPVAAAPVAAVAAAAEPPVDAPAMVPGADLDLTVPVTGKRATLAGFTHEMHTPLQIGGTVIGCLVCHERTAPDAVTHRAPSKENCMICHKASDDMPPTLRKGQIERLPLPIDHKVHVGDAGLDCVVCHKNEPERAIGIGTSGHESCTVCHSATGGVAPFVGGDPNGVACIGCHGTVETVDEGNERTRYLRAHLMRPIGRVGDVSFTHMTHASFSVGGGPGNGPPIECQTCHADAADAETKEEISKVQMHGCMECHRQANAVGMQPPESCQGCHLHMRTGLMPTNELVLKKPIDHTPFFRRHHADAAREHAPLCASCHAGTSGSDGNRCDTCHTAMKPRDHTAGFRDKVHGRQAQINSERCQTCHRAERCESCHREIPRSHFPLNVWVDKGLHGSRGRLEMGACLTCHRFETACSRCHTAVAN